MIILEKTFEIIISVIRFQLKYPECIAVFGRLVEYQYNFSCNGFWIINRHLQLFVESYTGYYNQG